MLRRTYGSVKSQLARVAGSTGMNTSDARLLDYVNIAIEEVMNEHDFPSVIDRLRFCLSPCKRTFVLPSDYDRMLMCTVDGVPAQMQSPWFEFVGYGLDLLNSYASVPGGWDSIDRFEGVLDREDAAGFNEIPCDGGPWYIRVMGTKGERVSGERPVINIQGYDYENNWIRTSDGAGGYKDGIDVPINGDSAPFWVQVPQSLRYLTATIKPVTKGNVLLYVSNADNSEQRYIGQYAPNDTTPFYRQYSIPALRRFYGNDDHHVTILARCRKRFVPVTKDADFLLISNLPALQSMVQACYYRDAKDQDSYLQYKTIAVDILKKEAKAYIGLQRMKPFMTVSEGPGVRQDGVFIL